MTDINELEIHWEKVSWDITTRLGTDMSKIVKWGDLTYLDTREYPKVVVEFDEKSCKIQIYDVKVYTGTEFPTPEMKNLPFSKCGKYRRALTHRAGRVCRYIHIYKGLRFPPLAKR